MFKITYNIIIITRSDIIMIRRHYLFYGRVQGVGFRFTTYHLAKKLGLTGWVCNLSGVLQLNNINFFETLDIALFFCQFFCIFYSYFLVLCDIIVSGGVSYG